MSCTRHALSLGILRSLWVVPKATQSGETHDGNVTHQDGTLRVDAQRLPEVEFRQLEPLLLVVGEADAVPSVVMPSVDPDGRPEAGKGFLQLLDDDVLVAEQCVSVSEVRVDLEEEK